MAYHRSHEDDEWHGQIADAFAVDGLIGPAFIQLVESKFAFNQPFHYFDADGDA